MNAETIHKLANQISKEADNFQLINTLNQINTSLQNMIQQPQHGQHQQTLVKNLKTFYDGCEKSLVNTLSPAWYQILVELNIDHLFGLNIKKRIENIINSNTITPQNAKNQLQPIVNEFTKVLNGFKALANGAKAINIGLDELNENEYEIGVMIPRIQINNSLDGLEQEIKEMKFILNIFTELAIGSKETIELKSLSTTNPLITVSTKLAIVLMFTQSVSFLIDNYKTILEIRVLHSQLKEKGMPEEELNPIESHCEKTMSNAIEELVIKLDKETNTIDDKKRKKEVLNGLRFSLNKIANRIDRGFNYEVRMPNEHKEDSNKEDSKENSNFNLSEKIQNLQFLKTDGQPVLKLEENKEK